MATIGGYPVRKFMKNCFLTAMLGSTSGITYRYLKEHPKKIKKVLAYSSVPGCAGLLLGCSYGFMQKGGMVFPAIKGAANFFLISCSYFGVREALEVSEIMKDEFGLRKSQRFAESTASGIITGFIVGSFWWKSPVIAIKTAAAFGAVAATGQLSIDKLQKWRIKKAIMLNYPELNELEWLALTTDEQDVARREAKSWWLRVYEKMLDKPQTGKMRSKQKALAEELYCLEKEEYDLLRTLGLENDNEEDDFYDDFLE